MIRRFLSPFRRQTLATTFIRWLHLTQKYQSPGAQLKLSDRHPASAQQQKNVDLSEEPL